MDAHMGSLMSFLRRDPEYKGKPTVIERKVVKEADAKKPNPSKPNVDHEAVGVENYEDEDLNKVKSQTIKNVDFAVRQVKDKEVETPIPAVKAPTKESKGQLFLCNDCTKTFRAMESKCPTCHKSECVERVVAEKKVLESVHELVGEVPGINPKNQKILLWALRNKVIEDEWPEYEVMFDALAHAGVEASDEEVQNVEDIQGSYLQNVLLPQAKRSYMKRVYGTDGHAKEGPQEGAAVEGKVPDKNDDEAKIVKKLTEEKDEWRDKVVSPMDEALQGTNMGYYHQATRRTNKGIVYEFKSVSGGPDIEVRVIPNGASAPESK